MKRTPARPQASDPKAAPVRIDGVAVRTVGDELVVYDPKTTSTHVLNPVAAAVFGAADGVRTRGELGFNASLAMGEPVSPDQVDRALSDLCNSGLIRLPASDLARRRLLIGGVAAGAMAVPTVLSVIAPSPAAAMSDDGGGTTGGGSGDGGVDGGTDGGVVTTPTTLSPRPVGVVTTLAGVGSAGFADGPGAVAGFRSPFGLAVGLDGTIYVSDAGNNRIRAIDPASGEVSTFAGSSQGSTDGPRASARFSAPGGMAMGANGVLYIADTNNSRIRAIDLSTGLVSTLAGSTKGFLDGIGSAAQFNLPFAVAVGASGLVYVADTYNHRIRVIDPASGAVTTIAGGTFGFDDGTGAAAKFRYAGGLAVGTDGNVYVADTYNYRIRRIVPSTGVVTTLAGSGSPGFRDAVGGVAKLWYPIGVAVARDGTLYVADTRNDRIRAIDIATGGVTTLAGSTSGFAEGSGTSALFNLPKGVAVGPSGTVYVADSGNNRVRKIT